MDYPYCSLGERLMHHHSCQSLFCMSDQVDTHPAVPTLNEPSSTIHLVGGEKGGVGKSLVARLLVHYLQDRGIPFHAFDADHSNGALRRFYPEVSTSIWMERHEELDRIIETAFAHRNHRILVDMAAQTHELLLKWMSEVEMIAMVKEAGFSVRYWHVMDTGKDSVDLLKKLFDRFEGQLQYTIVLNQVRGDHFDLFEKSGVRQRAEALQAKFVSVRHLMDHVVQKIDASNAPFLFGKNPEHDNTGLGLVDRQRVKIWLTQVCAQIDNVGI